MSNHRKLIVKGTSMGKSSVACLPVVLQGVLTIERALLVAHQREAWQRYCDLVVANVKPLDRMNLIREAIEGQPIAV